jgi:hypothetical protein
MEVSALKHEIITVWYRGPELLLGEVNYSTEVDIWSVGCIFAEMVNGTPLFPGPSDAKQLDCILESMGTPNPADWPNVVNLPLYTASLPPGTAVLPARPLHDLVPRLRGDADGLSLLAALLQMDPSKRITADAALQHPFFTDLKRRPRRSSTAAGAAPPAAVAATAAAGAVPAAAPAGHALPVAAPAPVGYDAQAAQAHYAQHQQLAAGGYAPQAGQYADPALLAQQQQRPR